MLVPPFGVDVLWLLDRPSSSGGRQKGKVKSTESRAPRSGPAAQAPARPKLPLRRRNSEN